MKNESPWLGQLSHLLFSSWEKNLERLMSYLFGKVPPSFHLWGSELLSLLLLFLLCCFGYFLSRWATGYLGRLVHLSRTKLDDFFWRKTFFNKLPQLVVVVILYLSAPQFRYLEAFLNKFALLYLAVLCLLFSYAALDALLDFLNQKKRVPPHFNLKGISQAIKIFFFLIALVYAFSVLLGETPWRVLSGIGAVTAILVLVFRDTILGFVAGIQIYVNDLLRVGDWIEMPSFNADGSVIDISLVTVKVQNWDKTITNLPTYALVANSFKNWRGMEKAHGRRIKRQFLIDMSRVAFVSAPQLKKLKKIMLLREYFSSEAFKQALDPKQLYKELTNLGLFREYAYHFIKNHPACRTDLTHLVRIRPTQAKGVPLEIYFFCRNIEWVAYERIQSEVIEHLIVVSKLFSLKLFQDPSGPDFKMLLEKKALIR